jgi:hypothetical protein
LTVRRLLLLLRRLLLLLLLQAKLLPLLVHMVLRAARIACVVSRLVTIVADDLAALRRSQRSRNAWWGHGHR